MTLLSNLQIFCGTWNVNGKPVKEDLAPWLVPKQEHLKPDLYALGFQEFDLTKESFVKIDEERVNAWDHAVLEALAKVGDYVQIGRQQLVGMLVILYSKAELTDLFQELDSDMIGTGYLGIFGNKGGVGVRFRFQNDTFCIVNSHFNAHQHNVERRNNDYKSIISRMLFRPQKSNGTNKPQPEMALPDGFVASDDRAEESSQEMPPIEENRVLQNGELGIFDHQHVIWFGDLNYRVDLSREDLMGNIEKKEWNQLYQADQLQREIGLKHVFENFKEGFPGFLPSYKFDSGTDNYDSSRKMRLPAYCDRVLWRDDPAITILDYQSHLNLKISDHKPVSAILDCKLTHPTHSRSNSLQQLLNSAPSTPPKDQLQQQQQTDSDSASTTPTTPPISNQTASLSKTNSNPSLVPNNPSSPSSTSPSPDKPAALTSSPSLGKLKSGGSSGNLKGGTIQPKSYLLTTGYRFLRKSMKNPSTYVFLAVAVGALAYYAGGRI